MYNFIFSMLCLLFVILISNFFAKRLSWIVFSLLYKTLRTNLTVLIIKNPKYVFNIWIELRRFNIFRLLKKNWASRKAIFLFLFFVLTY